MASFHIEDGVRNLVGENQIIHGPVYYGPVSNHISREDDQSINRSDLSAGIDEVLASFAFSEMLDRRNNIGLPHADTCQWILDHDEFKTWDTEPRGLLWIKGKPGAGKSTLMSFLYDRLSSQRLTKPGIHLDFFFSARGTELQHTPLGMFRSLLNQLFRQSQDARVLIRARYRERSNAFGQRLQDWKWQLPELQSMFLQAIIAASQQEQVTVFVDALDEAGENDARDTARYFHRISDRVNSISAKAKICISCRHYPIPSTIRGKEVAVDQNNAADITSYVHNRLNLDPYIDDIEQWEQLKTDLVRGANGVFQWVHLVLPIVERSIVDGLSIDDVRSWLLEIPEELKSLYEHILQHVIDARYRKLSLRLFQWVCLAERPLTVAEMRYALNAMEAFYGTRPCKVSEARTKIQSDTQMIQRTKALSGGLVEVVGSILDGKGRVQVIHQSVNDFLLSIGLSMITSLQDTATQAQLNDGMLSISATEVQKSQWLIFSTLVVCLATENVLICSMDKTVTIIKQRQYSQIDCPLITYAAIYLHVHAEKAVQSSDTSISNQEQLLQHMDARWTRAYHTMTGNDYFRRMGWKQKPWSYQNGITALHAATGGGLNDLVQYILQTGASVNVQDAEKNTPLHVAVELGYETIVATLLKFKAENNIRNTKNQTPLLIAAARDHIGIFKLLIRPGVDYKAGDDIFTEALVIATEAKSINVLRHLISSGANINVNLKELSDMDSILQIAASAGSEEIVRILLAAKADVNMYGPKYGHILQAVIIHDTMTSKVSKSTTTVVDTASEVGHESLSMVNHGVESIVRILLDAGADVNAPSGRHDTILNTAVKYGTKDVIRIILAAGANVDTRGTRGTALGEAVFAKNHDVIRILLDAGAMKNRTNAQQKSVLSLAVSHGDVPTIRMLLDGGVDINAHGGTGGYALREAVYTGEESILRMLLDAGADVNYHNDRKNTALHLAVSRGTEEIVRILLSYGADVNIKTNEITPLMEAVDVRQLGIIRILIVHGASPQGALLAAVKGHPNWMLVREHVETKTTIEIVQLLLDAYKDTHTWGQELVDALNFVKSASSGRPREALEELLSTIFGQLPLEPEPSDGPNLSLRGL